MRSQADGLSDWGTRILSGWISFIGDSQYAILLSKNLRASICQGHDPRLKLSFRPGERCNA
jgi:hypothetical protein